MRNSKLSKTLAATMAATMFVTPLTALADDETDITKASSSIEGTGQFEGQVDTDVFAVVLPTISDLNFTIDPQGLLNKSDSTKYDVESGAVYFANTGGTFSNTSDAIKIANKSSYDIEVGLSVSLDSGDIKLAKQGDLATATSPSLYLGIKSDPGTGTYGTATAIEKSEYTSAMSSVAKVGEAEFGTDGTVKTPGYTIKTLTAPPASNPNLKPSASGNYYSYQLTDAFPDANAKYVSFQLTGECDDATNADWSKIDTEAVTATVAWSIYKSGAPRITGSSYNRASTTNTYSTSNITEDIKSIAVSVDGTTVAASVPAAAYSLDTANSILTINGTKAGIGAAADGKERYFIVTFADDSKITFKVNVTNKGDYAYSRSNTANAYTLEGNTQEIKSMVISTDGSTSAANVPSDAYELDSTDKTALTINGTKAGVGAGALGSIRYFIITFADDTTATLCVNVAN